MNNKRNFLAIVLSVFCLPTIANVTPENDYLKAWKASYVDLMTQQEKHLLANIIYNLLATTTAEWQIRQFASPIARLNQTIRTKIDTYQNPTEDIAMLRTLLERLSYVTSTRTIYAQTLSTCIEYHNKNASPIIESALAALQLDAQVKLRDWANQQSDKAAQLLKKSSTHISDTVQHFQGVSRLHKGMSEGQMPVEVPAEESENNALIVLSVVLKNNPELLAVTDSIVNMLNETSDQAANIILAGLDIYKAYYAIVYDVITSAKHDKRYATTLFSMYDVLPDEYKTQLPDADHVFEHMLQTTKLYTQTEVSPL